MASDSTRHSTSARLSSTLSGWLIQHGKSSISALIVLVGVAFSGLFPLQYDFSFTSLFVGEGPAYDDLRDYLRRFGADVSLVVVAVESDHLYTAEALQELQRLEERLEGLEGVDTVVGPVSATDLVGEDGTLREERIVPQEALDDPSFDAWDEVRRRATTHPLLSGAIYGEGGRHAAIVVRFGVEDRGALCNDGVDNDGDGTVDCEEPGCFASTEACRALAGDVDVEQGGAACTNGVDDDGDGFTDCEDDSCVAHIACSWRSSAESGRSACGDGVDNDADGRADCEDADCLRDPNVPYCTSTRALMSLMDDRASTRPDTAVQMKYYLGGVPYVSQIYTRVIQHDLSTFVPVTAFLTAIVLLTLFRNGRGVVLPSLVVGCAVLGALGLMMLLGGKLNIINSSLPTLLLVIAVADSVHVMSRYFEESRRATSSVDVARRTMGPMMTACALTSITSAVGFATLMTATLPVIRGFGQFAALGILFAFVVTMLLVPATLARLPLPDAKMLARAERGEAVADKVASVAIMLIERHARLVWLSAAVFAVFCAVGISRVEADSHLLAELSEENPAAIANAVIEEHLGGVLSGAIMIYGQPGDLARPEVLRAMDNIGATAEAWRNDAGHALVSRSVSLAPVIREAHADYRGDEAFRVVPESRAAVMALLDQIPNDQRERLVSADASVGHITLRMYDEGHVSWSALRQVLLDEIERELLPLGDFRVVITGSSTLGQDAMQFMIRDLLSSLALAALIIMLLMTALFRSWRIGLISMIPNLLPLLVTLAMVGYLGISMRVSTAIVFSVSLGIAVDDTIHLLVRLREEQRSTPEDFRGALNRAIYGAGRGMVYTTILLCVGFGMLMMSEFTAVRELGLLGTVTLVVALVGDLVFFPLVLLAFQPRIPDVSLLDK
ncbi:MAG: putative RND superfamily exporter protein [Bradymonadia bacterium]|jgi:predicted RND superfamily exporter protein